MINHLFQYFGKLTLSAWFFLLLPFVLIGIIFLIRKFVSNPVIKWVSYFVVVMAFMRITLFYNPVAWAVYNQLLPLKSIDWRHHDVIICEGGKYLKPQKKIKYLAVGSSQTSVIYNTYARQSNELSVFALAGLSPLDLYTYRHEIVRKKPEFVLLYLSEFDIARNPELSSSRWSKFSLSDIHELKSIIDTTSYFKPGDDQIVYDLFFSKYFPEFKYSFVFKDLVNIIFNKDELLGLTPPTQVNDSLSLKIQLQYLNELSEKYIPFNMYYLEKAIKSLNQNKIRVIIIEGQYNPQAYVSHNLILNKKVRYFLADLTKENPENIFLTRDEIPNFVLDDYRDGYHVKENSGLKFAENLIQKLDSKAL